MHLKPARGRASAWHGRKWQGWCKRVCMRACLHRLCGYSFRWYMTGTVGSMGCGRASLVRDAAAPVLPSRLQTFIWGIA